MSMPMQKASLPCHSAQQPRKQQQKHKTHGFFPARLPSQSSRYMPKRLKLNKGKGSQPATNKTATEQGYREIISEGFKSSGPHRASSKSRTRFSVSKAGLRENQPIVRAWEPPKAGSQRSQFQDTLTEEQAELGNVTIKQLSPCSMSWCGWGAEASCKKHTPQKNFTR